MIPVFQTRYAVETFGNCFEACIASILELPLSAVPDRSLLVDADAWADAVAQARRRGGDQAVGDLALPAEYDAGEAELRAWLADRGLAVTDVELGRFVGMTAKAWLTLAAELLPAGFWIAHTVSDSGWKHATVWAGRQLEHDPWRGGSSLGDLVRVSLLIAADPARIARTLDPLPDVAGLLEAAAA